MVSGLAAAADGGHGIFVRNGMWLPPLSHDLLGGRGVSE